MNRLRLFFLRLLRITPRRRKFRTWDHAKLKIGEQEYILTFTDKDGNQMAVCFGQPGFEALSQMVLDMLAGTPSYSDNSAPKLP